MDGKVFIVNGQEFISPNGYPKFAFRFDGERKKYAIANLETMNATVPFIDELIYSELPLETWTADYVVVKVDGIYHLADNNGNCFYESDKPFIICRNLFVDSSWKWFINKNLEKQNKNSNEKEIFVQTIGGYKFAFYTIPVNRLCLIDTSGEINDDWKYTSYREDYTNLLEWIVIYSDPWGKSRKLINEDFKICCDNAKCVGEFSKTYRNGEKDTFYSRHFKSGVTSFWKFGELEIVVYDKKTYFFWSDGVTKIVNTVIGKPVQIGEHIVYREDFNMIRCDSEGKEVEREELKLKDVYFQKFLETKM